MCDAGAGNEEYAAYHPVGASGVQMDRESTTQELEYVVLSILILLRVIIVRRGPGGRDVN